MQRLDFVHPERMAVVVKDDTVGAPEELDGPAVDVDLEIDDAIAHRLAIDFWRRALPLDGTQAEPVGKILRDMRAQYIPDPAKAPATTYLAYVYYGHPRLTLQMTG